VNGSRLFDGGRAVDAGGFTKVMPCTVGETEGLAVVVGGTVGEGLAGHALLLGLTSAKPWNVLVGEGLTRGLSGIGRGAAATPGLAVTVITMVSDTCGPAAHASVPNASVAALAVNTSVMSGTRRRDPEFTLAPGVTG
jgi:hypothetical protein